MTKIQNPIIGRATGQAGGMIFSKMYDSNVMRSRPLNVTPSNTPAQKLQREFVAELGKYASQTNPDMLVDLFPNKPATRSRFSQFQKDLAAGRDVSGQVGTIDFDIVHKIGNGPNYLSGTGVTTTFSTPGIFSVSWEGITYNGPTPDNDNMVILAFNTTRKEFVFAEILSPFLDEDSSYPTPLSWIVTDDVVAFVAVRHKAGAELSGAIK